MIVRGKYPDYLMHYGVSIKDGAPGVGTGNWRRGGSSVVTSDSEKDPYQAELEKNGFEHKFMFNYDGKDYYHYTKNVEFKNKDGKKRKININVDDNIVGETSVKCAKKIEKNASKIFDEFCDKAAEWAFRGDHRPWNYQEEGEFAEMSKEEAMKHFKNYLGSSKTKDGYYYGESTISIDADPDATCSFIVSDGGAWWGHVVTAYYDPDTGKFSYFAMEG